MVRDGCLNDLDSGEFVGSNCRGRNRSRHGGSGRRVDVLFRGCHPPFIHPWVLLQPSGVGNRSWR